MKTCHRCGTEWTGLGRNPRPRDLCEGCNAYLHACANCEHFDKASASCRIKESRFFGSRTSLNYCDLFLMRDHSALDAAANPPAAIGQAAAGSSLGRRRRAGATGLASRPG